MNKWGMKAVLCGAALQLTGCFVVDDDDDGARPLGTLTVEWTIDGLQDPSDCAVFDVDHLELLLYTRLDVLIDELDPVCESFGVSLDLVEGRYNADATLIDSASRSATDPHAIDDIVIVEGTELVVDIDFPLDSFR